MSSHFFPDFLIPPPVRGPFPAAFAFIASNCFCSSFCFCLKATSSSSISFDCFLGCFKGFFFPPSLPDMSAITSANALPLIPSSALLGPNDSNRKKDVHYMPEYNLTVILEERS
uniref:Uncharacterized protein n=1 Tax=Anguilla anguilla TaxID=7936 RepID=A0A0E9WJ40_ANGAN